MRMEVICLNVFLKSLRVLMKKLQVSSHKSLIPGTIDVKFPQVTAQLWSKLKDVA